MVRSTSGTSSVGSYWQSAFLVSHESVLVRYFRGTGTGRTVQTTVRFVFCHFCTGTLPRMWNFKYFSSYRRVTLGANHRWRNLWKGLRWESGILSAYQSFKSRSKRIPIHCHRFFLWKSERSLSLGKACFCGERSS